MVLTKHLENFCGGWNNNFVIDDGYCFYGICLPWGQMSFGEQQ